MKKHLLAMLLAVTVICTVLLAVPAFAAETDIELLYDDRKALSSLVDAEGDVSITNEVVTSCKVGTTTKDDHVLVYQDGTLYAVGTGTATLTVGDKSYNVTVKAAPISLFMITGHSIGAGQEGNGSQSIVVEAGQAYSSYHQNSLDITEVDGYGLGWGSENRVGGVEGLVRSGWDSYGHLDSFAPGMGGTTGAGSGLAYEWNKLTGEKVWIINIAIGGSCVNEWLPGNTGHNTAYDMDYYNQSITKFSYAQTVLKNEVAAGHYTLSHQGILNFPGYNFAYYPKWSVESLKEDYETLWSCYTEELGKTDIDGDGTPDGLDVMSFTVAWANGASNYDRPVAWYMGTSEAFPQHTIASAGTLSWCDDLSTFPAINYETQSVAPYVPVSKYHTNKGGTSDQSLFCKADTTHYSQVGYNAIGQDMGINLVSYFKGSGATAAVTSIRLEDYYSKLIPEHETLTVGETYRIVPVVKPVTVSNLTYEVTGAAELTYPLAVKGTGVGTATLTVKQGQNVLATVTFDVEAAHSHCECGGKHSDSEFHTCGEALTYVPLTRDCFTGMRYNTYNSSTGKMSSTSESYVLRGGNYYLDGDYSMSSSICVAPGETVNLCLNGYKLSFTSRAFKPCGNLNICDCSAEGTGQVYSSSTGAAPIMYSYSASKVSFYGGTFSAAASTKREYGGLIAVGNDMFLYDVDGNSDGKLTDADKIEAEVNFYGGKFIGTDLNCTDGSPTVGGSGACIYVVNAKSVLKVYGGEFVGARPVPVEDGGYAGGGVIGNKGTTYIYGGIFRNSECSQGAIWTNNSNLHIAGSPVFMDNNNADVFLHYCDHLYIEQPGLTNETPIRITGSADNWTKIHLQSAEDAQHFVGVHGSAVGTPDSSNIMKLVKDVTYCECGGTMSDELKAAAGHVCADKTWSTLNQGNHASRFTTTSTTTGQTSTARYYLKSKEVWLFLSGDVNLTNEIEVSDGYTLHIDLNGYTITHSTGSASLFRVYGKLTICDSYGGGRVIGVRTGTDNAEAAAVYALNYNSYGKVLGAPEFNLYSGTLTGFNITSNTNRTRVVANQSGVVQIGNNNGNKLAVFNMYGGTVKDGYAKVAGNVYLGHGVMNMYDGLITGGEATTYGGNVRVGSSNTFTMYGGTIRDGLAGSYGGNIMISAGTNRILGGTFENGLATTNGGNVYLGGGTLELRNATLIGGGAIANGGGGGNMYIYGGTANVYDTVFKDGTAGYAYERNADGTLSYSTADAKSGNGGNLYINNATANLEGCTLENGLAYGKNSTNGIGGNIYNRYTLTMDGCTVSGGDGFRGSAVGIRDSSSSGANYTELKNCTFFDNGCSVRGSSVGAWVDTNGATIVIENCTFDDRSTESKHGVLAFDAAATATNATNVTVKDCTIKNANQSDNPAYGIYVEFGTVALEGNVTFDTTDANIYLISTGRINADNLETTVTVDATFIGEIGTSATDKSASFTSATQGITWEDGVLYINGLLKGENGTYKTFAEALAAGETRVQLLSDFEGGAEIADALYLDLNGNTLTGDITGAGTLYGMDSATNDYTTKNMGAIVGSVSCTVASAFKDETTLKRYMAIADETGYTFHRFYLGITHMNLRPDVDGVGYKAAFYGDEMVQANVTGYGYSLQLGENGKKVTAGKEDSFASGQVVTARVRNFDVTNYGEATVSGQVYLTLSDGTTVESTVCSFTLRSLAEQIAANASAYSEAQLAAVRAMLTRFEETTSKWNIDGLK